MRIRIQTWILAGIFDILFVVAIYLAATGYWS